ncbi:MAG: MFS transporter [Solirubrobacteraceae bacterium]|nr:MFS transporter [Solirubrobacteraceae bacterium]
MNRRLLALVCVVIFIDTLFYAVLAPALPALSTEFDLDKSSAGVLVGAYAAGTLTGALPGGWASERFGAKPTLLAALGLMTVGSVTFALADTALLLDLGRFVQGLGGALSWLAGFAWVIEETDADRRGEVIGFVMAAAVVGAQFGPVLGIAVDAYGRPPAFGATVAAGLIVAVIAARMPRPTPLPRGRPPQTMLSDNASLVALWLVFVAGLGFGILEVLVPLDLGRLGAGALAIGLIFFIAAAAEAVMNPLVGRFIDRRGVERLIRWALFLGALGMAVLATPEGVIVVAAMLAFTGVTLGALFTPGARIISRRAEALDVDQGWAGAFQNIAWAGSIALGAVVGGAVAQAMGDGAAYALGSLAALSTGVVLLLRRPVRSLRSEP